MIRTRSSNFFRIIFLSFLLIFYSFYANSSDYISRGYYVIDLKNKIEWLRCPVGMVWQKNECEGKALKLELIQVKEAIKVANEQLGGPWRLPTRLELESLICRECINVKINTKIFPHTPAEPFWSGEKNIWQPRYNWIVNFFNGNTFGRFPDYKPNYARLVRDRN